MTTRTLTEVRSENPDLCGDIRRNGSRPLMRYQEFGTTEAMTERIRKAWLEANPLHLPDQPAAEDMQALITGCKCYFSFVEIRQIWTQENRYGFDLGSVYWIYEVAPCTVHQKLGGLPWQIRRMIFVRQHELHPMDAEMAEVEVGGQACGIPNAVLRGTEVEKVWIRYLHRIGRSDYVRANYDW